MTKKIHKWQLQMADNQILEIPMNAEILSAQFQSDVLCIWALVSAHERMLENRHIFIFGTEHEIDHVDLRYINTVQRDGFVWHIFEPKYTNFN